MVRPHRKPRAEQDVEDVAVVDLRAPGPTADGVLDTAAVRAVLESAAEVIFSDGVSREFLDQWTFETVQLLEAKDRAKQPRDRAKPVSAGRR